MLDITELEDLCIIGKKEEECKSSVFRASLLCTFLSECSTVCLSFCLNSLPLVFFYSVNCSRTVWFMCVVLLCRCVTLMVLTVAEQ